ncbi:MAG: electron transfer flavoprotein subunit beta/FixA family protein [Planctomycetes bacterium]|nr:electron transfer flavoprotein subunit beta/FixA family protein [Planctomycetota bacterium]
MDLVVCIKRVPDSAAKIKVGADGKSIDPSGVDHVISPYDEMALERALQIKEEKGGTVTVLCLGPAEAQKEIRQALAMGADKAVHLKDAGGGRGPLGIAKVLAEAIKGLPHDAVLCGRQAIDSDNGAVGVLLAGLLGLPCVTLAVKLEMGDGKATVHRESEAGTEVVEVKLPALFTAQRGLAEPRYPSIKGIMMAKKKPIEEREAPAPSGKLAVEKLQPPAERTGGKIVADAKELARLLREEAKVI